MLFALSAMLFVLWLVLLVVHAGNFLAYAALVASFVLLVVAFSKRRPPTPNTL